MADGTDVHSSNRNIQNTDCLHGYNCIKSQIFRNFAHVNEKKSPWGYINAIVSAATFGTIPLFSIPVLAAGMLLPSVLVYRFAFGCLFMLAIMVWQKQNLHIRWAEGLEFALLSLMYSTSAICLFQGYNYMPSGIATTLLFSYPIWTAIILVVFFHEKLTLRTAVAIALAFGGVFMLSGIAEAGSINSLIGVGLELFSGLSYSVYVVTFPKLRIRKLPALKVNFYIFFMAMIQLALYSAFTAGGIAPIPDLKSLLSLILLGLVPTTISNVTLVKAMTLTDSTTVAILGAFEPLTAMVIGICVMGEPLTLSVLIGFVLIIAAVLTLIMKPSPKSLTEKEA